MLRTDIEASDDPAVPVEQLLANLLFGAYRHRVLSLLFLRPGDSFHVRMIARLTGVPAGSLHRELRQLADAGLLSAVRVGNQIHYSANEASPVFDEASYAVTRTRAASVTVAGSVHAYDPLFARPVAMTLG